MRIVRFLSRDIWTADIDSLSALRRWLITLCRALVLAFRGLLKHRLGVWASALTYTTLISVVPFVALVAGLGAKAGVPGDLAEKFTSEIAEAQRSIVEDAAAAFEALDLKALGVVALLILLYAAVKSMIAIEKAFNDIWGVERGRSLGRRVANYVSIAVLGPLLVLVAMVLTGSVMSSAFVAELGTWPVAGWLLDVLFGFSPYFAVWLALFLLYWLMPNTRVRFTSALIGAVVAGILWLVVQKTYFRLQVGISREGVVYGAFAAIPIFLIWCYFSWMIVLFGTELSYAAQNARSFGFERGERSLSQVSFERTALRLALVLARRFEGGEGPIGNEALAGTLRVPARLVNRILAHLRTGKLVTEVEGGEFQVARPPRLITAEDVVLALRRSGEEIAPAEMDPAIEEVTEASLAALRRPLAEMLGTAGAKEGE